MVQTIGVVWDEWTPKVESSIARDLLELKSMYYNTRGFAVATTNNDSESLARLCKAIQVDLIPATPQATVWKAYYVGECSPSVPDYAETTYAAFVGLRKSVLTLRPDAEGYPALFETRNNRPAPIGLSPLTKSMPPRNGRYLLPPWAYI